jgi:hypothetical protein
LPGARRIIIGKTGAAEEEENSGSLTPKKLF